jgi:hypothetical protein
MVGHSPSPVLEDAIGAQAIHDDASLLTLSADADFGRNGAPFTINSTEWSTMEHFTSSVNLARSQSLNHIYLLRMIRIL